MKSLLSLVLMLIISSNTWAADTDSHCLLNGSYSVQAKWDGFKKWDFSFHQGQLVHTEFDQGFGLYYPPMIHHIGSELNVIYAERFSDAFLTYGVLFDIQCKTGRPTLVLNDAFQSFMDQKGQDDTHNLYRFKLGEVQLVKIYEPTRLKRCEQVNLPNNCEEVTTYCNDTHGDGCIGGDDLEGHETCLTHFHKIFGGEMENYGLRCH